MEPDDGHIGAMNRSSTPQLRCARAALVMDRDSVVRLKLGSTGKTK